MHAIKAIFENQDHGSDVVNTLSHILNERPQLNAPKAVWPYPQDGDRSMRSFEERLPKGGNAVNSILRHIDPQHGTDSYKVQEKMNGVYVLWDGKGLWTKTGRRIDAPTHFLSFLPSAFALVGELFFGYGHDEFQYAKVVSQNKLPSEALMKAGSATIARGLVWQHARIIAFDVPQYGYLSYADRHSLLWQVVASWSKYLHEQMKMEYVLMPLQAIVQYSLKELPQLFKEVVHGVPWVDRSHLPFGIPICNGKHDIMDPGGNIVPFNVASEKFYGDQAKDRQILFGEDFDKRCCGEGLMLWDQRAPWQARGAAGRPTRAILKYKPRGVTVGVVTSPEPLHSNRLRGSAADGDDGDDGGRLPGYSISLDWWDNMMGRWTRLRPYVSANLSVVRCASMFAQDQMVFFTFVMYDKRPQFLRALGPHLNHADTLDVQAMMLRSDVANALRSARPLDTVRDASMWDIGETHILFPTSFDWKLGEWLQYSMPQYSRRVSANRRLNPDLAWQPSLKQTLYSVTKASIDGYKKRATELQRETERKIGSLFGGWLSVSDANVLPRFLVSMVLVIAAWIRQRGATDEWWGQEGLPSVGVVQRWGPFHINDPKNANNAFKWMGSQLGVLLTMLASCWLQYGMVFRSKTILSSDDMGPQQAEKYIKALEKEMKTNFIPNVLRKRWDDENVRRYIHPPEVIGFYKNSQFEPEAKQYSLSTVARYFIQTITGDRTATPVNLMSFAFGAVGLKKSVSISYVLEAQAAHDQMITEHVRNQIFLGAIDRGMNPDLTDDPWSMLADELPLERMTLLPRIMGGGMPQLEVNVVEMSGVSDELSTTKREVRRLMMTL